jgi:hypothetical protein
MKKGITKGVLFGLLVFCMLPALIITCDSSGGGTEDTGLTGITGIWLVQWESEEPYQYTEDPDDVTDAFILEIGETDIQAVFYLYSEQVGGFKGTYTDNGDVIVVNVSHTWNNVVYWMAVEEETVYEIPYSLSGASLMVTGSDPLETVIGMEKKDFSMKAGFAADWYWLGDGESQMRLLDLSSDGKFTHFQGDASTDSGIWDASDDFLRITSTYDEANYGYLFNLYESGNSVLLDIYGDIYSKEFYDLTVDMEKTGVDGITVHLIAILFCNNEERHYYGIDTDFAAGSANETLSQISAGEYKFSAHIDTNNNYELNDNEFFYDSDPVNLLIIDSNRTLTIQEEDWELFNIPD